MDKKVVEMNHIKRTERKLMYTGSMLSMYSDTIVTPDGNTAKWDYIEHSGAAAVVPVLEDGRILLVDNTVMHLTGKPLKFRQVELTKEKKVSLRQQES